MIAISAPIPNLDQPGGPAIGVIHGGVTTERIEAYVNQLQYGQRSYAFLLNSEGRPIIHPDPALMSTIEHQAPSFLSTPEPELAAIARKMVNHEKGISRIKMDGEIRYVAYLPLRSADWSVALVIPRRSIYSQLRMLDLIALFVLALAVLMLAALWRLHKFEQQQLEEAKTTALLDERNRLAREIHDTLAQSFTGISLQLEAVRGVLKKSTARSLQARQAAQTKMPPAHRSSGTSLAPSQQPHQVLSAIEVHILRARDLARQGLSEARCSVRALRSEALETETLPEALRKALAETTRDTGLATQFYLEGTPVPLPDNIQLNLLRIGQEAITNTLRHAQATQLDLTLIFIDDPALSVHQVQLRIMDNGVGFNPDSLLENAGFGLIGIRERVTRFHGTFELLSTPGIGTTIEVVMPLKDKE